MLEVVGSSETATKEEPSGIGRGMMPACEAVCEGVHRSECWNMIRLRWYVCTMQFSQTMDRNGGNKKVIIISNTLRAAIECVERAS